MTSAIRFDRVHRYFADHAVLRGLDFTVEPGSIFALLGRNGAGKTTALRILLGFLEPHHGYCEILGTDSRKLSPRERGKIAYVGEDHRLYASMRVREAIEFEAGTRVGFRRDFVTKAIDRCAIPLGQRIFQLSRGQRAQLALVLSVGTEPELLIFDDPALGLDAVMRRELLDALIDLLAEVGCTVLFSSHHLHDVERIADRVGILHGGQLIVDATLDDLKSRVQRRAWIGTGTPPPVAGTLCCRRRRDGYDLTLLDVDATTENALTSGGAQLAPPSTPTLEELFLDLTADDRSGIFSASPSDQAHEASA